MRWTLSLLVASLLACDGEGSAGPAGAACASDASCEALHCVAADEPVDDLEPLPLVCGELEGNEDDGGDACDSRGDCARGICLLAGGCARPCERDADCGKRERCAQVFARTAKDSLAELEACVAVVDLDDRDGEVETAIERDAVQGGEAELELRAFERDAPTFVVLEHLDPDWPGTKCRPPLCLQRLSTLGDDPVIVFDAALEYREEPPRVPVATGDHVSPVVVQLPGAGSAELAPDAYLAELRGERDGDVRVTRISGDGGRTLDLNVFYVGALALAPQGERGPAALAEALDRVDEILGQADIAIGHVRQIAVRGALPMRGTFSSGDDPGAGFTMLKVRYGAYVELPGLFQLSAGAGNRAINLFLLSDIEPLMPGREPEAQAGGIPGAPAMHGTSGSGIAVAADMMVASPAAFGRTLAHEIAHYLGLFHVSEADGTVLDNLDDTPACLDAQDADRNGLSSEECADHGADNLMFWAKVPGVALSEQQRTVLRASPVLR